MLRLSSTATFGFALLLLCSVGCGQDGESANTKRAVEEAEPLKGSFQVEIRNERPPSTILTLQFDGGEGIRLVQQHGTERPWRIDKGSYVVDSDGIIHLHFTSREERGTLMDFDLKLRARQEDKTILCLDPLLDLPDVRLGKIRR